jgi:hypothetical protein
LNAVNQDLSVDLGLLKAFIVERRRGEDQQLVHDTA